MADIVHAATRLLLFSIITTCVNGEDGLVLGEHGYDIIYPCEQVEVCFQIWQLDTTETHDYIATVKNGEIQKASTSEDFKCKLKIRNLTAEDVGRLYCRRNPIISLLNTGLVTLQCVLLSYVQQGVCIPQLQHVSLVWVDEAGARIQEDEQHHVKQESSCAISLTVTPQSPGKKFRCQASVGEQVQTSDELHARVPGPKRGARGFIGELERENKGSNQDIMGLAVGVVGCAILLALVAVFVVKKRRTSRRLPEESCNVTITSNDVNADDLVYADIKLPVASDRVLVRDSESTEYACVLYK